MRFLLAVCAALLAGCGCVRPPDGAAQVLDGFERDPLWAHDSADDHATMACEAGEAVQGATALVVRAYHGPRGKVLIRKEVDLDASGLTGLSLAARCLDGPAPQVALALRGADGTWLESPFTILAPGWNRDLSWDPRLAVGWAKAAARIERLIVLIKPDGADCTVALDDLRATGTWRWRSDVATLGAVEPPPAQAGLRQPLQLAFTLTWPPDVHTAEQPKPGSAERLLRRQIAGGAWITAPDGERFFQPAASLGEGRYAVRFAPDRAGSWLVEAGVEGGAGHWQWAEPATVAVSPLAASPGAVRVDPRDRRWLARADGSFVWPLGLNVAWAGDYTPWLDRLQASGCTALRVWLCPWSNPLDVAGDLQAVNQASATTIDGLLDAAAARGLTVQLCLTYHGWFGGDWARNPFNTANGGPLAEPREFWTDGTAKAGFRRLLDYVSARWGHHPGLLAWELVNECDLAPRFCDRDLIDWHREMAAHLARVDRRRHPITTSVSKPGHLDELWRLGDLDLVNVHRYQRDALRAIAATAATATAAGKPGWAAEAGLDWRPGQALAERDGDHLRQALWWSWMHGLAASSWAWWWDVQVQNQDLTRHHSALARYLAGEDPRGLALRPVSATADGLAVAALLAADRAWVYAADPTAADPAQGTAQRPARRFTLAGVTPGGWTVERWDVLTGAIAETAKVTIAEDGRLDLTAPAGRGEAAWKLRRTLTLTPDVLLAPTSGPSP